MIKTDSEAEDIYEVLAPEYESRVAHSAFYLDQRRCERAFLGAIVREYRGGRALDVGCGPGYTSCYLARLGFDVVAVDRSPSMRAIVSKALANYGKSQVLDSDACGIGEIRGQFEVIVSFGSVINHLHDETELGRFAAGISSKLTQGGHAIIGVDNLLSLDSLGWLAGVRSLRELSLELRDLSQRVWSLARGRVHQNHWLLRSATGTLELPLTYFPRDTLLTTFERHGLRLVEARGTNIIASLSPAYLATSEFMESTASAKRGLGSRIDERLEGILNRVATYSLLALQHG